MSDKRPYPTALRPYVSCASYIDHALAVLPGGHTEPIDGHVPKGTFEIIVKYRSGNPMRARQKRIPIHELTTRGLKLS